MVHKSDLEKKGTLLCKKPKDQHGIKVQTIRCNNAGENNKMEEACVEQGLGTKFEYTAMGAPQQNGRVERKFATFYGRVGSMMIEAEIKEQ